MKEHVEEQELTQEELAARKEEMLNFYKESLPYLQAQCEYEELLARIDEARFKRTESQIKFAMMMQGPPEEKESEQGNSNSSPEQGQSRKLKKQ